MRVSQNASTLKSMQPLFPWQLCFKSAKGGSLTLDFRLFCERDQCNWVQRAKDACSHLGPKSCEGDATELTGFLSERALQNIDLVVSGLPFSTMRPQAAKELVEDVYRSLTPGEQFVAYQVRDIITELAAELFETATVSRVF